MLSSNLKYLREKHSLTQADFANILGISRSTYSSYEKNKSEPTVSLLLKCAKFYQIKTDDLLLKDIRIPYSESEASPPKVDHILSDVIRILPITTSHDKQTNIELVPAKAIAGYALGMKESKYISELPKFYIPNLPEGTYRAFEIAGDSMPPIEDGYIVIGSFVNHARDLKNGKRYILILRNEGVVFKKVINEINSSERLILTSDNSEFYPYSVSITDVLEAWELVAFIGFPDKIDMNYVILDKLHDIQQQITLLASGNSI